MDAPYSRSQTIMPGHLAELDRQGPYDHYFGGEHKIRGGECPNCQKPLILHLTLDTSDPRLNLGFTGLERLRLLFCMRCDILEDEFVYRIHDDDEIEIIEYCPATVPTVSSKHQQGWYEDGGFPDVFPKRPITLHRMPDRLQELIDKRHIHGRNSLTIGEREEFAHLAGLPKEGYKFSQIGGFGGLWQAESLPYRCEACKNLAIDKPTGFLAVLTNSPPRPGGASSEPDVFHNRDFAVCLDCYGNVAFSICMFCNAVHAVSVA